MTRSRTWIVAAASIYLSGALVVGLWPTPVDGGIRRQIADALAFLHRDGIPSSFGYNALEFGANIAFFVPIGILVCLLLPRRIQLLAIPIGALVSCAIELSQLLFLPARFATWNDVLANTTGTVIGVVIVMVVMVVRRISRPATAS